MRSFELLLIATTVFAQWHDPCENLYPEDEDDVEEYLDCFNGIRYDNFSQDNCDEWGEMSFFCVNDDGSYVLYCDEDMQSCEAWSAPCDESDDECWEEYYEDDWDEYDYYEYYDDYDYDYYYGGCDYWDEDGDGEDDSYYCWDEYCSYWCYEDDCDQWCYDDYYGYGEVDVWIHVDWHEYEGDIDTWVHVDEVYDYSDYDDYYYGDCEYWDEDGDGEDDSYYCWDEYCDYWCYGDDCDYYCYDDVNVYTQVSDCDYWDSDGNGQWDSFYCIASDGCETWCYGDECGEWCY